MDNALLGSFIQHTDGLRECGFGLGNTGIDGGTGAFDSNTGSAAIDAVAQTTLVVLPVTLDLGLDISHLLPPENNPIARRVILLEGGESVQTSHRRVFVQAGL